MERGDVAVPGGRDGRHRKAGAVRQVIVRARRPDRRRHAEHDHDEHEQREQTAVDEPRERPGPGEHRGRARRGLTKLLSGGLDDGLLLVGHERERARRGCGKQRRGAARFVERRDREHAAQVVPGRERPHFEPVAGDHDPLRAAQRRRKKRRRRDRRCGRDARLREERLEARAEV